MEEEKASDGCNRGGCGDSTVDGCESAGTVRYDRQIVTQIQASGKWEVQEGGGRIYSGAGHASLHWRFKILPSHPC